MHRSRMTRMFQAAISMFALVAISPATLAGTVVHVDDDGPPGGDGTTWATAYRFLQDGLGFASNPANGVTEVRVGQGVYRPDRSSTNPDGSGARSASFHLISGVALVGGYVGIGGDDPDHRDPDLYETILSGDLSGDDLPEFVNTEENSFHVVVDSGTDEGAVLDGFIITAGNADGTFFPDNRGGGLCAAYGGGTIVNCVFVSNSAHVGGGVDMRELSSSSFTRCAFVGNRAFAAVGGMFIGDQCVSVLLSCRFVENVGEIGGSGGLYVTPNASTVLVNCSFIRNTCRGVLGIGGGMIDVGASTLINCVFSQNVAASGGGLYSGSDTSLINCTFSNNTGSGLVADDNLGRPTLTNCILWGNTPEQVASFPDAPGITPVLNSCDIQGGWTGSGSGNIDVDPLFVQPASDDVRLAFGSPCVNAGSNAALPPDTLDLDGDGDTTEPIPVDLAGNPRIVDGTVDLGAYEGEYDPLPPMAEATDFDQGETAVLNPNGGGFDPMAYTLVAITNVSGADDAMVMVTEWGSDNHPGAGGYSELAVTLGLETSLYNGQYGATVFVPFDLEDLAGADPLDISLTYFDPAVGNWGLAVAGNTHDSPGSNGPIGDRIAVAGSGPGEWGLSTEIGDYGVFWNATEQQGFVWANVDHAADFAIGAALCPVDCDQTPNGRIDVLDLIALLMVYGPSGGGGPCDVNQDGVVDVFDLILVLGQFGAVCP